jgi:trehalose 6-phosphate synthase
VLGPDDLVWVHDYHLIPLAKALRERGYRNLIGFFLHIPCPPPEMLTALPHHERLIPSLCEYDLVGFQTGDDAFNFSRYLTRECGLHSRDFNFIVADRPRAVSRLRPSPISPIIRYACHSFSGNRKLNGRALIIGIDRLGYSKGIRQRLSAFELFLQTRPEWRGKVTYLQIALRAAPRFRNMPKSRRTSDRPRDASMAPLVRGELDANPLCQPCL